MIWLTPYMIQSILVAMLAILVGFYLWCKLHENDALKYEFITIITHKFRTPMTHVKWILADLIQSEKDSFRKENLIEMQKSNDELVKLVSALIELTDTRASEKSSYKFERIDLVELIKENFRTAERAFKEKNISVSLRFANPQIFVKADRSRLEFVISALLENASMYTFTGGNVAISVVVTWRKAVISVADDGVGINPRDMRHIGTRFFRTKNASIMDTTGFGVNLYLSRSIIRRHHGKLLIFSPGLKAGSTFEIILPRVK